MGLSEQAQNLTPAHRAAWAEFNERLGALSEEVFGEFNAEHPFNIVVGAQFGGIGKDDDLPACLVSSSLPLCYLPNTVEAMLDYAVELHELAHNETIEPEEPAQTLAAEVVGLSALPDDVREYAASIAKMLGVPEDEVGIVVLADISDLGDLPEKQ